MISPSDFYRDNYFFQYINGKHVPEESEIPVEPAKSLTDFISSSKNPPLAKMKVYRQKHPGQNIDLQIWIDEHRILSKSKIPSSTNGKGFDFVQVFTDY